MTEASHYEEGWSLVMCVEKTSATAASATSSLVTTISPVHPPASTISEK